MMEHPEDKYLSSNYIEANPTWDMEDSAWKAQHVINMIRDHGLASNSICEVGCGAGGVLSALRDDFVNAELTGFDIAPAAQQFWNTHKDRNIDFKLGNFFDLNKSTYDVILLLDVLEHVVDPFDFLRQCHPFSSHFIFHFPLDLSASSVIRESPLLYVREKVGHIHYFTKGLALRLLAECGFEVLDYRYTGAAFNAPQLNWKSRMATLPRKFLYAMNKDIGVRILGGETLVVLAKSDIVEK